MKFGISKDIVVMKTNIEGKVLSSRDEYRVYRCVSKGVLWLVQDVLEDSTLEWLVIELRGYG